MGDSLMFLHFHSDPDSLDLACDVYVKSGNIGGAMMRVRDPLDPKTSLWHFLAYALRFEREKHGLSLAQCGKIINAARSTVCNIEAGRLKLHEDQARALDQKYGTPRLFELLLYFARTAHDPDWFRQYTEFEAQARVIRMYQGQVIPVPFQTEEYARALLSTARDNRNLERALAMRTARQAALFGRKEPPVLVVLLDQDVLDRPVGGPKVMRAQLQQLLELSEGSNVMVRVIPRSTGEHFGLNGPFQVMSLDNRDVAYIGAFRGGRLVQDPAEVREMAVDFELIGAKASSEDMSRILIEQLMEEYS
ncbi:helix-turn-helix domain-containing protein [Thermomonospora cellulosilytica]|uniref:Transcriptional regulator with XRE-family HTH domain n=1 Tax=Thermomonospora cellulosilytica TaxID=1411118 RepID=A0A7W3MVP4_9ACTN|nr:helix-turn-helix transcriptional regulator [Thermomonospora cellulosilytica]MBA9002707.1 transcriptional regulator with XRE-family HTH domain [Thermomonospora cellulosilytica]